MRGVRAVLAVLSVGAVAAPIGCSLLFNGQALLTDLGAGSGDMNGLPDDLGVGEDMAGSPLGDMNPACTPQTFNGFGDLGAIDCRCGCVLDDFNGPISPMRWVQSGGGGWSVGSADGTLTFGKPSASNGDAASLTGAWQLEGDFDLRIDYLIAGVPNGGRGMLVGYGPAEMGMFVPTLLGAVYQANNAMRATLSVGDLVHDVGSATASGTLRLTRKGAQSCVEIQGVDSACRNVTMPLMHVYLQAQEVDSTCVLCGDIDIRFSNARLVTGKMVPP